MDFSIEYLADHPSAIPAIAAWHLKQWGRILPDFSPDTYQRFLSTHYKRGGIPTMFVAVHEGNVIGTAALEDDDMDTRPELTPWLASLYVDEKYRHNGVGEALVKKVIEEARRLEVKKIYLLTPDRQHYHERFGFQTVFQENYYGEMESVMTLDLTRPKNPSRLWWIDE
jgi:N-acetylglutamate synthase-like GNAT family acetyltransferase